MTCNFFAGRGGCGVLGHEGRSHSCRGYSLSVTAFARPAPKEAVGARVQGTSLWRLPCSRPTVIAGLTKPPTAQQVAGAALLARRLQPPPSCHGRPLRFPPRAEAPHLHELIGPSCSWPSDADAADGLLSIAVTCAQLSREEELADVQACAPEHLSDAIPLDALSPCRPCRSSRGTERGGVDEQWTPVRGIKPGRPGP